MILTSYLYPIKPTAITRPNAVKPVINEQHSNTTPILSFQGIREYYKEISSIKFLKWGEERELIEKVNARREAKKIITGIEAIKILENPALVKNTENKEAINIAES